MALKFQFNKLYFVYFVILLIIEVAIAIFIKEGFIRSSFGDFLVVMLIYCFVNSFIKAKSITIAIGVLIFAFIIEFLQLFQILKSLNLQNNKILATVFGNTFQMSDLIFYTLGVITILIIEYKLWHFLKGK